MRIGITQRVDYDSKRNERRDILHHKWIELLIGIGLTPIPIPNLIVQYEAYFSTINFDGFILTGGNNLGYIHKKKVPGKDITINDVAYERDELEIKIIKYAIKKNLPVLGVCRGMQALNSFFGGDLSQVDSNIHVAKYHPVSISENSWQAWYPGEYIVNSFHNNGIYKSGLGAGLECKVQYKDQVEGFQHSEMPFYGIMWHPERIHPFTEQDRKFIKGIFS